MYYWYPERWLVISSRSNTIFPSEDTAWPLQPSKNICISGAEVRTWPLHRRTFGGSIAGSEEKHRVHYRLAYDPRDRTETKASCSWRGTDLGHVMDLVAYAAGTVHVTCSLCLWYVRDMAARHKRCCTVTDVCLKEKCLFERHRVLEEIMRICQIFFVSLSSVTLTYSLRN